MDRSHNDFVQLERLGVKYVRPVRVPSPDSKKGAPWGNWSLLSLRPVSLQWHR